jgi:hypothetical protein
VLLDTIGRLSARVAELEQRVRYLEARRVPAPLMVLGPGPGLVDHAD